MTDVIMTVVTSTDTASKHTGPFVMTLGTTSKHTMTVGMKIVKIESFFARLCSVLFDCHNRFGYIVWFTLCALRFSVSNLSI